MSSSLGSMIDYIGVNIITIKKRKHSKIRYARQSKKCYTSKLEKNYTYMALLVRHAILQVAVMTQIKDLYPSVFPRR